MTWQCEPVIKMANGIFGLTSSSNWIPLSHSQFCVEIKVNTHALNSEQFNSWNELKYNNNYYFMLNSICNGKEKEKGIKPLKSMWWTTQLLTMHWLMLTLFPSSSQPLPANIPLLIDLASCSVVWNIPLASLVSCPAHAPSPQLLMLPRTGWAWSIEKSLTEWAPSNC